MRIARRRLFRPIRIGFPFRAMATAPSSTAAAPNGSSVKFLSATEAQDIDKKLMSSPGFSVDQLMELAGLSVAIAIEMEYAASAFPRVAIVAGPGNNGGDGLVAARHLFHFGYRPTVLYPKQSRKEEAERLFGTLCQQLRDLDIPLRLTPEEVPDKEGFRRDFDLLVDAIFGFSFQGSLRSPFDTIIPAMRDSGVPIVSVDIASGWHVEEGPPAVSEALQPDMLVSLTAPKRSATHFRGRFHYLGGRFLPPKLGLEYGIDVCGIYKGHEQVVRLPTS